MNQIFVISIIVFLVACGGGGTDAKDEKIEKVGTIASIEEASGICYVSKSDTLFVVGDNGYVYEIDKNGLELNIEDLSWREDHDFEGIAYDSKTDLLYIALEGVDNVLVLNRSLNYVREVNINRSDNSNRKILAKEGEGLEGISVYNGEVYVSNQSFKSLLETQKDPSVIVKLDSVSIEDANIAEVIDPGYINISGMTFHNEILYLVSDTGDLLIKYDFINKKVIDEQSIKEIDNTLNSISLEGVAFDDNGYIYFAIDDKEEGKIIKYKTI